MGKIISLVNQKGGVGKTTTSINLSASLAYLGKRVLLIDLDPQGNATTGVGINKADIERSSYDVITGKCEIEEGIVKTKYRNLYVLPATINLAGVDIELIEKWNEDEKMPELSENFKIDRSIRIIPISKNSERIENALNEFDSVVEKIEESILKESNGIPIKHAWNAEAEKRTCSACDFKTFCNKHKSEFNNITIP